MEPKLADPGGPSQPASANPMIDVVAPPPPENTAAPADAADPASAFASEGQAMAKKPDKKTLPKPPKAKQPGSGSGLAIAATVIIVLALAILATYAYLQTAK